MMTCTRMPRSCSRRTISAALYAAIPPLTPRATFIGEFPIVDFQLPIECCLDANFRSIGHWQLKTGNGYSFGTTFSNISEAASAGDLGTSAMIYFTWPALISSWAMRQVLREVVSITGGGPTWSWRARRAATRIYR